MLHVANFKIHKKHLMTDNDSSETIRKTPFVFSFFLKHLPQHKTYVDPLFLEWFVGFAEGEGSFVIQTFTKKTPTSPDTRLSFVINQEESRILFLIRTTLGFGTVKQYVNTCLDTQQERTSYWRYSVSDRQGIARLIHLFNGNLVLDKTNRRFLRWIEAYNADIQRQVISKNLTPQGKPPLTRRCVESLASERKTISLLEFAGFHYETSWMLHSGWLSGFTDAKGCFSVHKRWDPKYSVGFRVECRFILSQTHEKLLLEKISQSFGGGQVSLVKPSKNQKKKKLHDMRTSHTPGDTETPEKPNGHYRFACSNQKVIPEINAYFRRFELKTEKKLDFLRFARVFFYLQHRKMLPWEGKVLQKIKRLTEK
jgi:hypothetical protein